MTRILALALLLSVCPAAPVPAAVPGNSQLVVVEQSLTDPVRATIRLYQKDGIFWKARFGPVPALLGKNGTAWGRSPFFAPPRAGQAKREGDKRTPAGIFSLGPLYGYAARPARPLAWPYIRLTRNHLAIDDPASRSYNKIVDRRQVARDWNKAGALLENDQPYRWLLEVGHNKTQARAGGGSWIFLHPWINARTPTDGCTGLAHDNFFALLALLEPARQPRLVVVPATSHGRSLLAQLGLGTALAAAVAIDSPRHEPRPAEFYSATPRDIRPARPAGTLPPRTGNGPAKPRP